MASGPALSPLGLDHLEANSTTVPEFSGRAEPQQDNLPSLPSLTAPTPVPFVQNCPPNKAPAHHPCLRVLLGPLRSDSDSLLSAGLGPAHRLAFNGV